MRKKLFSRIFSTVVAAAMAVTTLGALTFTASATGKMPDTLWMFHYGNAAIPGADATVYTHAVATTIGGNTAAAATRIQTAIGNVSVTYRAVDPVTNANLSIPTTTVNDLITSFATRMGLTDTTVITGAIPILGRTFAVDEMGGAVAARNKYFQEFVPHATGRMGFYTFDTQTNMTAAMTLIRTEEQRILNAQLTWMRAELQRMINDLTSARNNLGTADHTNRRQYQNNINALEALRDALIRPNNVSPAYTYKNEDLFVGDVWPAQTHSILKLNFGTQGGTQFVSRVANAEEVPRMGGLGVFSTTYHHLDVTDFINNSWWRANSTATSTQGNMNWFAGQMIPPTVIHGHGQSWRNQWTIYDGYGSTAAICVTAGCNNPRVANSNFCSAHTGTTTNICAAAGCNNVRLSNSNFCSAHAGTSSNLCAVAACNNVRMTNSNFCSAHAGSSATYISPPSNLHLADASGNVFLATDTGFWYPNLAALRAALGNNAPWTAHSAPVGGRYSSTNRWFNYVEGRFQSTSSSSTIHISGTTGGTTVQNPQLPAWQPPLTPANPPASTAVNKVDAFARINNRNFVGWNNILAAVNANPGIQINIEMQEQTSIPASVLAAARTHKSTLVLRMANGALWNIRGENVTAARTTNLGITYSTRNVPAAAMNAVSKGAISRSQLTIGDNNPLGYTASVRVRYAENRAGRTVTLYRFNNATGRLDQVSRVQIQADGRATFTGINHGGDFVTIIT